MRAALVEARRAGRGGEVPVGALVAVDGRIVARAGNASIRPHDPTGHAEMRALRRAARRLGTYRLTDATVVVTLEPCLMCMGAMVHARIRRLVFGAYDPKAGAAASLYRAGEDRRLNHRFTSVGGVVADACGALLRDFFAHRRAATRLARATAPRSWTPATPTRAFRRPKMQSSAGCS
jgi:tRNA(adenine34) deaminase